MILVPLFMINFLTNNNFWKRPQFIVRDVDDTPTIQEIGPGMLLRELSGRRAKWAHFVCPKCGDLISVQLAGKRSWNLTVDLLRRPTISPSIWEKSTCGAHFFVRRGEVVWCRNENSIARRYP